MQLNKKPYLLNRTVYKNPLQGFDNTMLVTWQGLHDLCDDKEEGDRKNGH